MKPNPRFLVRVLLLAAPLAASAQPAGGMPGGSGGGQGQMQAPLQDQNSGGGPQGQGGGHRHGPPPEAIAACKDKSSGASCSFTGRRGDSVSGSCEGPPARPASAGNSGSPGNGASPPLACRPAMTNSDEPPRGNGY